MPIEKTCEHCAKTFSVSPSVSGRRFCSHSCHVDYRRKTGEWQRQSERVKITCEVCKTTIEVFPSKSHQRFCSQACMIKWRGPINSAKRFQIETHAHLTCQWCGNAFQTPRSRLKDGRGKFCSRSCRASYVTHECQNRVSKAETAFGDDLERVGLSPVRQHRIGRWTVDFYFPSHGVAVEFDGEYWHSLPRVIENDRRKSAFLSNRCKLVRIPERLWLDDPKAALALVVAALSEVGLPSAS